MVSARMWDCEEAGFTDASCEGTTRCKARVRHHISYLLLYNKLPKNLEA